MWTRILTNSDPDYIAIFQKTPFSGSTGDRNPGLLGKSASEARLLDFASFFEIYSPGLGLAKIQMSPKNSPKFLRILDFANFDGFWVGLYCGKSYRNRRFALWAEI